MPAAAVREASPNPLALALSFLTAIPVHVAAPRPGDLGRAAVWFPVVGLVLGVVVSAAYWLLARLFPPTVAATLTVALWAALTGGLHLDGLADCGDGLFSTASRERRLEIMRDPRLGAFGVMALVLFLLLKVSAVAALTSRPAWDLHLPALSLAWRGLLPAGPLVLAAVAARWLLLVAARQPSARPGGMGQDFASVLTPSTLLFGGILPLVLIALAGPRGWLATLVALVITGLLVRVARARLGGVTGDVFGLVVEMAELTILLTYTWAAP
jgi:adenosylcobinamide-GDP ribazoletransferase